MEAALNLHPQCIGILPTCFIISTIYFITSPITTVKIYFQHAVYPSKYSAIDSEGRIGVGQKLLKVRLEPNVSIIYHQRFNQHPPGTKCQPPEQAARHRYIRNAHRSEKS